MAAAEDVQSACVAGDKQRVVDSVKHHRLAPQHRDRSAIHDSDLEWTERNVVHNGFDLVSGHAATLTEAGEPRNIGGMDLTAAVRDADKPAPLLASSDLSDQIERAFTYHAPKGDQADRYGKLRAAGKELAKQINVMCPHSRERALAITNLENCLMWANASIARNE